jgi:hypothetical protein
MQFSKSTYTYVPADSLNNAKHKVIRKLIRELSIFKIDINFFVHEVSITNNNIFEALIEVRFKTNNIELIKQINDVIEEKFSDSSLIKR